MRIVEYLCGDKGPIPPKFKLSQATASSDDFMTMCGISHLPRDVHTFEELAEHMLKRMPSIIKSGRITISMLHEVAEQPPHIATEHFAGSTFIFNEVKDD